MFQKPTDGGYMPQPDEVETVVGPSVAVEGDFVSEGNIIVKGTVSGSVRTSALLSVEQGAKILANVHANSAIIAGHVKGNLKVTDRLEVTETAQVSGDISCAVLSIAPGALLCGKINMKGMTVEESSRPKRRVSRRKEEETADGEESSAE